MLKKKNNQIYTCLKIYKIFWFRQKAANNQTLRHIITSEKSMPEAASYAREAFISTRQSLSCEQRFSAATRQPVPETKTQQVNGEAFCTVSINLRLYVKWFVALFFFAGRIEAQEGNMACGELQAGKKAESRIEISAECLFQWITKSSGMSLPCDPHT